MANRKLSEDQIKWILSLDASDAEKGVNQLTKKSIELTNRNKDLRKSMQQLEAQGKSNTENYRKLSEEYKNNSKQISSNRQLVKGLEQQMGVTALSMVQLKRRSQDLQRQLDNTSQALHPDEWNQLNAMLAETRNRMSDLKNAGKEIENQFGHVIKSSATWGTFFGNMLTKGAEWGMQMLSNMKDIALEGIDMAASADGVTRAFRRMDNGTMLENLRKSTKGTVTDLELMKAAVKAEDFRIPLEDLGKYLAFAQLKAQQTGQSVDYMTDSIVTGLGRKSLLILDNLGLSSAEINEEIAKTGDFMSAVASIVDKQLTEAGGNYVSAADRATQQTVKFQNAQRELGETLLPLKEKFDAVYGSAQISTMNLIGWIVKHRASLLTLIAAVTAYRAATKLATVETYKNMTATKASILLDKLKTTWINNAKGATLLYAAAKAKLAGNTIRANAAMKLFNTTCKSNIIGLVISLVVAGAVAFFNMRKRTEDAASSMQSLKNIQNQTTKEIDKQSNKLKVLSNILHNSNLSYTERKKALDELQSIIPEYNASLTTEGNLINDNTIAIDNYLQALEKEIKLKAAKEELEKLYMKKNNIRKRLKKEEEDANSAKSNLAAAQFVASSRSSAAGTSGTRSLNMGLDQGVKTMQTEYNKAVEVVDNTKQELVDLEKVIQDVNKEIKSSVILQEADPRPKTDLIEEKKKEIEAAEKVVASTKEEIIARNRKVAALKAELEFLEKLGIEKKEKDPQNKSENEKKSLLEVEKAAIQSLEYLREEDLQKQQQWYNTSTYAFNADLSEKLISKEQHEMLMIELDKENAKNRLQIEQTYYQDAQSLELTNSELKEEIVRKSGQRVLNAEKEMNSARVAEQTKLNDLISDFKSKFKVTSVEEDYQAQKEVLAAAYQARKDMAVKNNLDITELDKANNRAKEQLESDHQAKIQAIRDKYGISTQQERFEAELLQLKTVHSQELLSEEEYEQSVQNLKRDSYKKQFDYYLDLFAGAVQALQQAEMDNVDAQYDAEIEAAKGNSEEVERLENEKAQKKLDIQKKYADVNFAIKTSQIIADTAVSIMKAFADLGPIAGAVAAALMGVTGIAQIASANAERKKVKNMTLSGSKSTSNTGARVATGRESGGKIDVKRAQDGKLFPNTDYDPGARGFIDRPTVIVGEGPTGQSKEWIASNAAVENPTVAPILNLLDKAQQAGTIRTLDLNQVIRTRMAGFSSGGSIDKPIDKGGVTPYPDQAAILPPELMKKFANAIINLDENGVSSSVYLTEFERKQQLRNRSRNLAKK